MACREQDIRRGGLLVSTVPNDSGTRELRPCDSFWVSPDLWLESGGRAGVTYRAVVGTRTTVYVRVQNIGPTDLSRIRVQAWVCDYTFGPLPSGAFAPPGELTGFDPSTLARGGPPVVIACTLWTPDRAQLATNGGHLCIAANVYAERPQDGSVLVDEIRQCCDSHHAQRNIAVVASDADGLVRQVARLTGLPKQRPRRVLAEFFQVTDPARIGDVERELLAGSELGEKHELHVTCERIGKPRLDGRGIEHEPRGELTLDHKRPLEVTMSVELTHGVKPGTVGVFDAVTRDPRTDEIVGGARLLAVVS